MDDEAESCERRSADAQRNEPCPKCPWRKDAPLGKFPPERYIVLAKTATQGLDGLFACHMSAEGGEVACAGYLAVAGDVSLNARLLQAAGKIDMAAIVEATKQPDYPELVGSFAEMAVANGVPADHESLRDPDLWDGRGPLGRKCRRQPPVQRWV